ncbi:MAG: (4Fe-4S)-binding protein [Deltaproteobacteria bacterium]|nr:(4Fe-4S)-binding protein [Deltaproteobacteria bacterium]
MSISADQRKQVKGQGFLSNKDNVHFSARVVTGNGVLTARQLKNLSEAAEKYADGRISFTSRMTVEVPGIPFENIAAFQEHIAQEGMMTGGTGPKVRPVVACKGTVCIYGNVDTQELAAEIHRRFYEGYRQVILPHKFKISVGGCPNNCAKPELNDIGIVGQRVPQYDRALCKGCPKCPVIAACPMNACAMKEGIMEIVWEICNNCGLCIGKCHLNAIPEGEIGYKITLGGRWGKHTRIGSPIKDPACRFQPYAIFNREEALNIVEGTILLFKEKGLPGERLSTTIERLGIAVTEKMLISGDLLERKEEILNADQRAESGA